MSQKVYCKDCAYYREGTMGPGLMPLAEECVLNFRQPRRPREFNHRNDCQDFKEKTVGSWFFRALCG